MSIPVGLLNEILKEFNCTLVGSPVRAGGTASPKWIVETQDGRYVLRMRPAEFARLELIRFDHWVSRTLRRSGLPAPVPVQARDGSTWVSREGRVFELLEWVDGGPFQPEDSGAIESIGELAARFHVALNQDPPAGKEGQLREDHPSLLKAYLPPLQQLVQTSQEQGALSEVRRSLEYVENYLDAGLYESLPAGLIHGDLHPGNVRFRNSAVSAVYDFDYVSRQARCRDFVDALIFFAASRKRPIESDNIWSLTQPFAFDLGCCKLLVGAYQRFVPLEESEWESIPLLIRSRWTQMRLRGSRKVPDHEKIRFVTEPFLQVIDWLDLHGDSFFTGLRESQGSHHLR